MDVARSILRYLKGTSIHGVLFKLENTQPLIGCVDVDWARDVDTRWSTIGMIFTLGGHPINWMRKVQAIVVLLITEVKYHTLLGGVKEIIWLKRLFIELQICDDTPTKLYTNYQSKWR